MSAGAGKNVIWMTGGTLLMGLSGFVFLALIGHGRFQPDDYAALSATYLILSIIGPGVFVATEQETSRFVSAALARRQSPVNTIRRLAKITAALAALTLVVFAMAAPFLLPLVLKGHFGLLIALAISVIGSAAVYLIRGLSGGQHRFRRYAVTLLIDGGVRLFGCLVLVMLSTTSTVAYGLVLCAGPLVAALLTSFGLSANTTAGSEITGDLDTTGPDGHAISWKALIQGMGWLLVASLLAMLLANLAGVIVTGSLPDAPLLAAGFTSALVLTRIPLLVMGPVQAMFLPRLSAAASTGQMGRFRTELWHGLLAVAALGLLAVTGVAVAGRWVLSLLFGSAADTNSTGVLVLLVCSAVMLMAISLLQPALIAIHRHSQLVWGWLLGAALFGVAFALPLDPIDRAVIAQLAGPLATLIFHLLAVRRGTGVPEESINHR